MARCSGLDQRPASRRASDPGPNGRAGDREQPDPGGGAVLGGVRSAVVLSLAVLVAWWHETVTHAEFHAEGGRVSCPLSGGLAPRGAGRGPILGRQSDHQQPEAHVSPIHGSR